jgi:hypothetical protein
MVTPVEKINKILIQVFDHLLGAFMALNVLQR